MQKIDLHTNKFAIIGLGDTGISIINYLKYHNANIVRLFDTRENPPHQELITELNIPLLCGKLDYTQFFDIDVIVISPGVSIYEPALQQAIHNGKLIVGDIELFAIAIESWPSKVIGITGSNGKTTVTSLCGFITEQLGLRTLIAGNIGMPVLTSYLNIIQNGEIPDVIVLELSSFQLETCYNLHLDSATVLNISEDHLDRYTDLLEYAYVKSHIFNNASVQVLNFNDTIVSSMSRHEIAQLWFGESTSLISNKYILKYDEANNGVLHFGFNSFLSSMEINLIGKHNYLNCLASVALLHGAGIDTTLDDSRKIAQALRDFNGLEHRMQKVTEHNGITYIEDSKGTNVGAVCAGISGLNMPIHLILGGDGKGQDFSPLRQLVQNKCNSVAIIGQDKQIILQVLTGIDIPIKLCDSLEMAIDACILHAKAGDAIILSPACASWDMFDNYKHRAKVFVDYINAQIN